MTMDEISTDEKRFFYQGFRSEFAIFVPIGIVEVEATRQYLFCFNLSRYIRKRITQTNA